MIGGRCPFRDEPAPGPASDPERAHRRREGEIRATVQPAVARATARAGHERKSEAGGQNRYGSRSPTILDGEAETADFGAQVYPAIEDLAQRLRDLHDQALEHVREVGDDVPASLPCVERLRMRADAPDGRPPTTVAA